MVTSGGTYWIWWESWLLSGCDPGETPGTVQVVRLEREQGQKGRRADGCECETLNGLL